MKLEKHITDTLKEWQLKIGCSSDSIRLYYPMESICDFLSLSHSLAPDELSRVITAYLSKAAPYLGDVGVTYSGTRFCIEVPGSGCQYVHEYIEVPEFLMKFLEVLKHQSMDEIRALFQGYALSHNGHMSEVKEEDGIGTVFSFLEPELDPYMYCVEQDDFGITYHRFARNDFERLKDEA